MNPLRFLRDLIVVLGGAALLVAATVRWVAVPWAVDGPSMEPTLRAGDRVVVDLWRLRHREPRVGEIVLLSGPAGEPLVKRIAREPEEPGRLPPSVLPAASPLEPDFVVLGDNAAASSDSRSFGRVPLHAIRGVVVWRYWPPSRFGPIR